MSKVFMVYGRVARRLWRGAAATAAAGGPATTTTRTTTRRATTSCSQVDMLKPITSSGASRLLTLHASVMTRFHQEQATLWRLPRPRPALPSMSNWPSQCVQHVVATCCRCRQFGSVESALFFPAGYAYRHLMWCHPRPFRDNEPCRAHGHP